MRLSPTVYLDRTARRWCLVQPADTTRALCGRQIKAANTATDTATVRRNIVNCPDCHQAALFVMDRDLD